jgi:NitT/TauT family transport system substrate-binding protein
MLFTAGGFTRIAGGVLGAVFATGLAAGTAGATDIRFTLDWAFQGPQSPFVLAYERGYYEEEGLNVTIDRGDGSGAVPPKIAAGTYDIGFADINPMIRFNAEKPEAGLIAVAVLYDASPLAVMALKKSGVTSPADLAGKTVAAPEADSGRQLFPAFAQATGVDASSVSWMSVAPQLRETMLIQDQAQAVTGFLTTSLLALKGAGVSLDDVVTMRYRDHGIDLYSGALITSKKFAEADPEAVRGFIRASVRGHLDALKDPAASVEALKTRDPLIDPKIEQERLQLSIDELILTPHVEASGFSAVDPARMQRAIDTLAATYAFPRKLSVEDVYSDAYLPPAADLAVPK